MREHERIDVHLFIHSEGDARIMAKLNEILRVVKRTESNMANEMQDLEDKVSQNTDAVDSATALIKGIKEQLDAAIASNDPAALQKLSDALGESNQQLADAIIANTPAAE